MAVIKNNPIEAKGVRHRGTLSKTSWSLCVGAGISVGLVPTWEELTRRVINEVFGTSYSIAEFPTVVGKTRWSLDALLQGAATQLNLNGNSSDEFANVLERHLYDDLLLNAEKHGLRAPLCNALNQPRWLSKDELPKLVQFFADNYSDSSLVRIARVLAKAKEAGKGPVAVINFNADTLLYALLDMFLIKEHADTIGNWQFPKASYAKALRGIKSLRPELTPIYHCHGSVSPKPSKRLRQTDPRDSREQLVFTEADYLNIAGNAATWAQSLFLFHAQSSRLVIVGHSLSDPNIRKWLGWSLNSSLQELAAVASEKPFTPRHVWIARRPSDSSIREIQEISLLHLGVRVCWIDDWGEVNAVISNLLAT